MSMTTEQVWEAFHTHLQQFIRKRVPDESTAEDLLQEVFLKIHQRIETVPAIEFHTLVHHGHRFLRLVRDAAQAKFTSQRLLVSRFGFSRAKLAMHLNRRADDFPPADAS